MISERENKTHAAFSPGLDAANETARHWLGQATLRLRREMCWRWRDSDQDTESGGERLSEPPAHEALDRTRYSAQKQRFFETDPAAGYLTELLGRPAPRPDSEPARGSFGWVVQTLGLDECASFLLALSLAPSFDAAAGPVLAACQNDAAKTYPTLALAQLLWDRPAEVLEYADPECPLRRYGLLQSAAEPAGETLFDWSAPLIASPLIARQLLFPEAGPPWALEPILADGAWANPSEALADGARVSPSEALADGARVSPSEALAVARLTSTKADAGGPRILPVVGPAGGSGAETAARVAHGAGGRIVKFRGETGWPSDARTLRTLTVICWLRGLDLYFAHPPAADPRETGIAFRAFAGLPVTIYLEMEDRAQLALVPPELLLPALDAPGLTYEGRVSQWTLALTPADGALTRQIAECARQFRFEKAAIHAIGTGLQSLDRPAKPSDLIRACRAESTLNISELAQEVSPRFVLGDLKLPRRQRMQFDELLRAMRSLTEVHYQWGAGRAWSESGLSALFSGAPGTGKTMAAEVVAAELGLPMFRIDLSQVVNKYIGETEKNLKRLFDRADRSDTLLFFDEADALFGRRTEVKDAHDRYANLEISYLLERMERFKGLAILATNRKKDLDEAFLRRLRFLIDFPLPEAAQRREIWVYAIPAEVDASALDFDFLAAQFQLAGGHIRSIVFAACLQAASDGGGRRLTMERVLPCVRREYEKLNRPISLESFGGYAAVIERMELA